MVTFEPADACRDRVVLAELDVAYLDWPDAIIQDTYGLDVPALLGQPIAEYAAVPSELHHDWRFMECNLR